jgi:phage gpG-like protein
MASDLGLYKIMEQRGYDRVTLDRCLANKPLAERIAKHTQDAVEKDFVQEPRPFFSTACRWPGLMPGKP